MSEQNESGTVLPHHYRAIVIGAIVLALLYVGRDFLIPLAIALLLWNLIEAIIARITVVKMGERHVPRWLAMILAIALIILASMAVSAMLADQARAIGTEGPKYIQRLESLFAKGVALVGPEVAAKAQAAVQNLDLTSTISSLVGSASSFLSSFVLILIYVAFMLAEQHNLLPKLTALYPQKERADEVRRIMSAISANIRKYIWIQTIMSLLTGFASYIVLRILGVDFAETLAFVIFLLNFIPTIGSALGVVFPVLLALVQFDTFSPVVILAASLGFVQFFIGNVLQPMFTGKELNLSAFVIILSLTFWGGIWGIVGMLLSVPITVMLMIVCANTPSWRWVAIMLSSDGKVLAAPRQ